MERIYKKSYEELYKKNFDNEMRNQIRNQIKNELQKEILDHEKKKQEIEKKKQETENEIANLKLAKFEHAINDKITRKDWFFLKKLIIETKGQPTDNIHLKISNVFKQFYGDQ